MKGSDSMRMYFLDSTEEKKYEYNQVEFARFHNQIIGSGVANTDAYKVSAKTNMDVALSSGWIFANGYALELEATETLTHDVADPDNDRIDRIVIRFDTNPEKREFYPTIIKGTPARSPIPPSITREEYIHDMSVAQVRIIAGKSHIEQYQISDERANDEVCGYIPLHNMYRGMQINELGMVTMPNQSYIEMNDSVDLELKGDSTSDYVSTQVPISPVLDRQGEVSEGEFNAKADGAYLFYFHLALASGDGLSADSKLEAYLVINGDSSIDNRVYLFNRPGFGFSDLHFTGSGIKHLNKGDNVKVYVATRNTGDITSRYRRMSIAKIS